MAAPLQCVTHQHRRDGNQTEQCQLIHAIMSVMLLPAHRRLPEWVLHPPEKRVFQDAI